jgi:ATP-dependent DNA helicase RecG
MSDDNGNSVKVAKYSGIDRVDLIENNEYGYCSLIKSAKQVLDKLELENKTLTQITSKERVETRIWNAVAIKEAVINAIVHNDYSKEIPPKFEIFSDRLEITSAGGLPEGMEQDEFFEGFSVPRNKEIMRIFKDLDMVEYLGSGVPRILRFYNKECFVFSENFLRMIFPASGSVYSGGAKSGAKGGAISELSQRQLEILEIIRSDNTISYRAIAKILNINPSAILKHIESLKEKGFIIRKGGTRGYWKVK